MEKGLSHADYNRIFTEPVIDGSTVKHLRLSELYLPTGEIVVTDPLVFPEFEPLRRKVNPGTYPVDLYIAHTPKSGRRVAIAVLTFASGVATRYELALRGEENLNELEDAGGYFGFPVDGGLGAFYDQETSGLYDQYIRDLFADRPYENPYDHLLAPLFKKNAREPENPNDCGDWLDFHIPTSESHNMAMFQSGYGDGLYPAYWGVAADGTVVNLVIDFHVLLLPEE